MNWPGVGIQRIPPAPVLLITPRARWEGWQGDFHQPQLLGLPYGGYPVVMWQAWTRGGRTEIAKSS